MGWSAALVLGFMQAQNSDTRSREQCLLKSKLHRRLGFYSGPVEGEIKKNTFLSHYYQRIKRPVLDNEK